MRRVGCWIGVMMIGSGSLWAASAPSEGDFQKIHELFRKGADVRLWGQINRAALFADNGSESEWFHVDNDSMPSRLGMAGDYASAGSKGWTVGGQMELGFKSDNSGEVAFGGPDPEFDIDGRKIEAYAKHARFGSVAVGQGDMASNGTAEEDLGGTYVAGYSQVRFAAASLVFGPATNGPTVKSVFNNFDGLHRDDRFRYDSPAWRGVSASTSVAGEDFYDAALRHGRKLGSHQIASAIAYAHKGAGIDQFSGSCSVLLGCGLNVTAALGGQNVEGETSPISCYGKVGYNLQLLSCGATMLAVDYSRNEEVAQTDDLAESCAVILNQRVDPISSEVYATVRNYTLDRAGEDYDDLWVFMSGINLCFLSRWSREGLPPWGAKKKRRAGWPAACAQSGIKRRAASGQSAGW